MGVDLAPDEVAYRCNLVTVDDAGHDGRLRRRPPHERAEPPDRRRARRRARAAGATACASIPASSTATCASCRATGPTPSACRRTTSPGSPRCCRPGPRPAKLVALMDASQAGRARRPRPRSGSVATQIWLWGQGVASAAARSSPTGYGVDGRLSSAVDLVRGLGVLTGIEVVDVPGATAGLRQRLRRAARRRASRRSRTATSSSSTSRRPTRPATRATSTRRSRALERWDADDHRSARRRARRRAVPHPPPARPRRRRARCRRTRPTRCRTSSSTRRRRGRAASTPSAASPDRDRSRRTSSWRRLVALTPAGSGERAGCAAGERRYTVAAPPCCATDRGSDAVDPPPLEPSVVRGRVPVSRSRTTSSGGDPPSCRRSDNTCRVRSIGRRVASRPGGEREPR